MKDEKYFKTLWNVVVIGGGQSGLATGYYLKKSKADFVILDENTRGGESWRKRWDSLRLFTPNWLNSLPGMTFPEREKFPSKDETAEYLLQYKQRFDLPVRYDCTVTAMTKASGGYRLETTDGLVFAKNVVIATGNYSHPKIPAFANDLSKSIVQIHSSKYLNPAQIPDGETLVVGAGTSGLQIALDLISVGKKVYVAGKPPSHIPDFIFKYFAKQFVWIATNLLNTSTPIGRKMAYETKANGKAAPLINITLNDVVAKGAVHLERITGSREGWPMLENGGSLKIASIIWATGFLPDYNWIRIPDCIDGNGYPESNRGVSARSEGLYFVGSVFQYGLTSAWLGGVARDAEYVCQHIQN